MTCRIVGQPHGQTWILNTCAKCTQPNIVDSKSLVSRALVKGRGDTQRKRIGGVGDCNSNSCTSVAVVASPWSVQEHVYNTTVQATCLPHTGFASVWTPATHAEFSNGTRPYINTALGVRMGLIPHTVPHRDGSLQSLRHVLELVDLQTMWISLPSFTNHSF